MRHGTLKVVKPVAAVDSGHRNSPFLLQVADDDGSFLVVGSRWVRERWAGAAPVEPSTFQQLKTVEQLMLGEAEKRRHQGAFDLEHPMLLDETSLNATLIVPPERTDR